MPTEPAIITVRRGKPVLGTVELDAVLSEEHELSNTVTPHPIESGAPIADHSIPNPDTISLDCGVTNFPADGTDVAYDRAVEAYTRLWEMHDKPVLIDITTSLRDFTSMTFVRMTAPRDVKTANGLRFKVTFQQVKVVANRSVRVVQSKDPRAHGAVNTGKKTTTPTKQESSALFDTADGASKSSNGTIAGLGRFLLSGGK